MLYQYTTLEALAQILKNQTIRFSRLDQVDDLEEGMIESQSIKLSKFIFVSCWTEAREESIPLWKLYSGNNGGVRIGLEKDMFPDYNINDLVVDGKKVFDSGVSKVPREEILEKDYLILSCFDPDESPFYRKVRYVDDVASTLSNVVKRQESFIHPISNGDARKNIDLTVNTSSLGAIKHKRWEFEQESRFTLFIFPGNPIKYPKGPMVERFWSNILNGTGVSFTYYDLHFNPSILDSIEITMSPSSLPGQRIIVESLCAKYAPNAIIRDSGLRELVKMK